MRLRRATPTTPDSWEEDLACDCGALVTVVESDLEFETYYHIKSAGNAGPRRRATAACIACGDPLAPTVPPAVLERLDTGRPAVLRMPTSRVR
jgi:hypothetical protein